MDDVAYASNGMTRRSPWARLLDLVLGRDRLVLRRGFWELAAAALVVVAIVIWYTQVWDTPKGKCERGDLGACIVWQAQQSAQPSP
jgi:hypothetical protein